MTRRDLQEAISNLEYLVLNHFDPDKVEEYYRELQAFQRELQALDQRELFLTSASLRFPSRQHTDR